MKLSFKKEKPETGLAGMGQGKSTEIKADKKVCGVIHENSWNSNYSGWRIGLMVFKTSEDKLPSSPRYNPNIDWKWIFFKPLETEEAARSWLQEHWESIQKKFTLRMEE